MKKIAALFLIFGISLSLTSCRLLEAIEKALDLDYPKYTDEIADYNTEEYPVNYPIFMVDIPKNADVVSFCFYNYWNECKDVYLELKFNDEAELLEYLDSLMNYAKEYIQLRCGKNLSVEECFIVDKNPYNDSYTDYICTDFAAKVGNDMITGYSISHDDKREIKCYYGIISYSVSDLTVIQTRSVGSYREELRDQKYIPEYMERFSVDVNAEFTRWYHVGE